MRRGTRYAAGVCVLAVFLVSQVGCGGGASGPKGTVTGMVTYNDKPVDEGFISFFPADGKGSSNGSPITKGKYTVTLPVGKYNVTVTSDIAQEISPGKESPDRK